MPRHICNTMAGWSFTEAEIHSAQSGESMLNSSIDLSNPCNLNCPYCFIEEKNSTRKIRRSDEMTIKETLAIVEDFAIAGSKTVNIVGAGEPTIDPSFREIVAAIADRSMIPVIFTNGIKLAENAELVKFLYTKNATVVLKYNAIDEEVQDLVAGSYGYCQKRNRALTRLIDLGFNATDPTRLALDIIAFKGNYSELIEIHKLCRRNAILPILGDFIPTGRTAQGHFVGFASIQKLTASDQQKICELLRPLSREDRRSLYYSLAKIDQEEFGISRKSPSAYYSGIACTQILGLYVDICGNIWPCVARSQRIDGNMSPGLLGNIRNGDLPSAIWTHHSYMKRIRSGYTGGCPYKPALPQTVPLTICRTNTFEYKECQI